MIYNKLFVYTSVGTQFEKRPIPVFNSFFKKPLKDLPLKLTVKFLKVRGRNPN